MLLLPAEPNCSPTPAKYTCRPAAGFSPRRIVLAKGSNRTAGRQRLAANICAAYPAAEVIEDFDTPHNRIDLGRSDPLELHEIGNQTLVLAEHKSAVRQSTEVENSCPDYWHFSPYGFCPYGCTYCYFAGTRLSHLRLKRPLVCRSEKRYGGLLWLRFMKGATMTKNKDELVPYDQVSPGFEAVYTGETSATPVQENEMTSTLYSDEDGNLISQWCTIPWVFPNEEGDWKEGQWDDTVKRLHEMQSELGPLTDSIRQIRCHITGLIPCDSGLPVTVDELLFAIARGKLQRSSFKSGCLCSGIGCNELKTSQPRQNESIKTIHAVLNAYLAGEPEQDVVQAHPEAAGFINRSYQWLGAVSDLSKVQRKMLDRVLLIIGLLIRADCTAVGTQSPVDASAVQDMEALGADGFSDENGRGPRLDAKIAELAGLPKIHPEWEHPAYQAALDTLEDEQKQELYKTCCAIASGVHSVCDCHHSTFRYIESWIHGVATGRLGIPTRKAQAEKQRLGHMLFGYALGLDRWLMRVPLQFLLLDLAHIDLGFDPRNNILRVYACLGEEVTAVKQWLAACLWYNLVHNQHGGLIGSFTSSHTDLVQRCKEKGVSVDGWVDSAVRNRA